MRDQFRLFATLLLVVSVGWSGWLLAHPEKVAEPVPGISGGAALPSLDPVVALVREGRGAEAIAALAALVRAAPELADKGGPLVSSFPLRELILEGWKAVVLSSGDRAAELTKEIRFLQRRLAGGCS